MWRIGELLLRKKLITWKQLEEALHEQKASRELCGEILIRKGFVSRRLVWMALAEQYDIRFIDLNRIHINPDAVACLPLSIARKYQIVPVERRAQELHLAVPAPVHSWPAEEIRRIAGVEKVKPVLCLPDEIDRAIEELYADAGEKNMAQP